MNATTDADLAYMDRCLTLARRAHAKGETPVGSLVVMDDTVVGEGVEATRGQLDPSAHAEMVAIRTACREIGSLDLDGAVLYTTVEPCLLCGFAVRATGIRRIVIGTDAGEVGAVFSRHAFVGDPDFACWASPPQIMRGVLEDEARALLQKE